MNKYEIMYILKPTLDDEARKVAMESIHKIITDNGGKIIDVKEWGLRDLAYPIKKEAKGYYVLIQVEAGNVATKEFNRLTAFNPNMLRHLITVANN